MARRTRIENLLAEISACTICAEHLPHAPRPVLQAGRDAKLVIIGQAPGRIVHESGVPWDDRSGDRLRNWLGLSREGFYDRTKVALLPMGFCFPGRGKGGDLPPRPECAPAWHAKVLDEMSSIEFTLLVGGFAQAAYLGEQAESTLTATVRRFDRFLPSRCPLPHPSPRNNIWLKKNPWFEQEVIPKLQSRMRELGLNA